MIDVQMIEEVRDQMVPLIDIYPQYGEQLTLLGSGEWVTIDDELDFILACEVK